MHEEGHGTCLVCVCVCVRACMLDCVCLYLTSIGVKPFTGSMSDV